MSKPVVAVIPIGEIRENPVALRTVNRESESYIGLRDAIRKVGILNAINVRLREDEATDETYYELVDGLHRYTCALDVGLTDIPVTIVSLDDAQTLEAQIMANVHKIETKPIQYTKQLLRVMAGNPTMTLADMATKISKSSTWVSQRLNLLKLDPAIQSLVDDGKITVSNAVQLAKLPPEEQKNYVDQAITMGAEEFSPLVLGRAKELKDAARQGRKAEVAEFVASPQLRKVSELTGELETSSIGPELCSQFADTAISGFALGVAWALKVDPISIDVRKAADSERKAALSEEKKKRAADRAKKKAEEATKAAAVAAEAVAS